MVNATDVAVDHVDTNHVSVSTDIEKHVERYESHSDPAKKTIETINEVCQIRL